MQCLDAIVIFNDCKFARKNVDKYWGPSVNTTPFVSVVLWIDFAFAIAITHSIGFVVVAKAKITKKQQIINGME